MKVKTINGMKSLDFGYCEVFEERKGFYGIYNRDGELLTHRSTWRQATKIASLIQKAYSDGYSESKADSEYYENMSESYNYFNE